MWPFRKRHEERVDASLLPPEQRAAELLRRLAQAGWTPEAPADPASVSAAEEALGVIFPPDYRTFLLAAGRPSARPSWFGLWRIDEMIHLNRHLPCFRWYPGLVGIGSSGGFLVYALDYRNGTIPRVVSVGLSSSEEADVTAEGESFCEWLERTL